jgi:asparagine synthase (glutamine-hydrolysing)
VCGICGIVDVHGVSSASVTRMRDTMIHRGPDDAGLFIDDASQVGLGHRRLSIIDLSERGRQPLSNEDATIHAVVNGEFYGYRSQRDELLRKGHHLSSDSDSEILLHLYEDEGVDCVRLLHGMFGLALWDSRRRRLLLARDRVGKKPLYYAHSGGRFAFASELKALLTLTWVDQAVNPTALDAYLALGYVPGGASIVTGAQRLEPGTSLVYEADQDRVTTQRYWSLPEPADNPIDDEEALVRLEQLLRESVALRLISDVPVGVFLSGGVDSSVVAALAAQASPKPLKTYTIVFSESSYNEMEYARLVAEHIGSEHNEILVSSSMLDVVDDLPAMYDEPFADFSSVPTFFVSKATRAEVKVALAGDGGDELFGGYNWYRWVLRSQRLRRALGPLSKGLTAASGCLPRRMKGVHLLRSAGLDLSDCFIERTFVFERAERAKLLRPDILSAVRGASPEAETRSGLETLGDNPMDAMQRWDFSRYLPDDILVKVDRASMSVALEVRAPLLDHRVCEFAFSLPPRLRFDGGTSKVLLKRVAQRVLPAGFPLDRKQGFTPPIHCWLRGDFGDQLRDRVRSATLCRELIDVTRVDTLLDEHRSGARDNAARLWSLLMLALWSETRS